MVQEQTRDLEILLVSFVETGMGHPLVTHLYFQMIWLNCNSNV